MPTAKSSTIIVTVRNLSGMDPAATKQLQEILDEEVARVPKEEISERALMFRVCERAEAMGLRFIGVDVRDVYRFYRPA